MPGTELVVGNEYEYAGNMRYYAGVYYLNRNMPHKHRPVDSYVFVCDAKPRRVLLINRWTTTGRGGWATPEGGNFTIDGVKFRGWIWKKSNPTDDCLRFLSEKGHDFSELDFYKHRLGKNVSRSEAYNIYLYVEKGELESEEWKEIKPYVNRYVKSAFMVVGE